RNRFETEIGHQALRGSGALALHEFLHQWRNHFDVADASARVALKRRAEARSGRSRLVHGQVHGAASSRGGGQSRAGCDQDTLRVAYFQRRRGSLRMRIMRFTRSVVTFGDPARGIATRTPDFGTSF